MPASFLYVLQGEAPKADRQFGPAGYAESLEAAAGQKGGFTFFLASWPGIAEQLLEQELQLILTGILDNEETMSPAALQEEISRLSQEGRCTAYLDERPVGPDALWQLSQTQQWGFDGYGDRSTWKDLKLPMANYTYEEGRTVVLGYRTIMKMWALTKVACMGAELHYKKDERRNPPPPPPPPPPTA